jgi:hypothetical protein
MYTLTVVTRRGSELIGVFSKKRQAIAAAREFTSGDQYWGDFIYVTETPVADRGPCWSMANH